MHLVSTRQAVELTGLSNVTLREWTSRRALISADIPPKDRGSPAQFSWQTILLLRLAATLKDRFHVELQAHREIFGALREQLRTAPFMALWDHVLVIRSPLRGSFVAITEVQHGDDALVLTLDRHLQIISRGFALPSPANVGQLDMFPVVTLDARPGKAERAFSAARNARRRRSA